MEEMIPSYYASKSHLKRYIQSGSYVAIYDIYVAMLFRDMNVQVTVWK